MENKSMLKPVLIAIIFVVAPSIVAAQQRPSSLLQKRVTFTLADHWEIQKQEDSPTVGKIQILIPYSETDNTPYSANVAIVADLVPAGVTVKDVGDKVYGKKYPGMAVANDIPDGEEWRTIVWTARDGAPYLILNRFGCANGIAVEVMMAFPLLENGDQKWIEKAVSDFNSLCETLKIDAKNSTEVKVNLGKLTDTPSPKAAPPRKPNERD
jgi:hypothetical protein